MIFLVLSGLSSIPLNTTVESHKAASRALERAQQTFKRSDNDAHALKAALAGVTVAHAKSVEPVSDLYSQLGYDLRVIPAEYGVTAKMRLSGLTQGASDLAGLGQPFVKAKSLKVTTVIIDGTFTTYEGLKSFLHWFDTYTMSISKIDVKKDSFTLTLDLYGS